MNETQETDTTLVDEFFTKPRAYYGVKVKQMRTNSKYEPTVRAVAETAKGCIMFPVEFAGALIYIVKWYFFEKGPPF